MNIKSSKIKKLFGILKDNDFRYFVGVPSSNLSGLIYLAEKDKTSINICLNNEEEALGVYSGFTSVKEKAIFYSQSDGLGRVLNGICSLNLPYQIPLFIFCDLRGRVGEKNPVHKPLGKRIVDLLKLLDFEVLFLKKDTKLNILKKRLIKAIKKFNSKKNVVIFLEGFEKITENDNNSNILTRDKLIKNILKLTERHPPYIIASLGLLSRNLYLYDNSKFLYIMGSMGYTLPYSYGVSKTYPNKKILALIGDGELFSLLSSLIFIGQDLKLKNLGIIIFDNESFRSTGGQKTFSKNNLFKIEQYAKVCGINNSKTAVSINQFTDYFNNFINKQDKFLINVKISSKEVDVPRIPLNPKELLQRFIENISS